MDSSMMRGAAFGLTSGIITTIGLMIGLSGTGSKIVVIGGILTIAIADAMSDALGMHISDESEVKKTHKQVWISTFYTFIVKFLFVPTFLVPVLIFELHTAIWVSVAWGLSVLVALNYWIARSKKENPLHLIGEHLMIAVFVIVITYFIGQFIEARFA